MQISSGQSVREAEQRLFAGGQVSSLELMNTVIDRLWKMVCVEPLLRGLEPSRVVVYAGTGNNAGDAIGLAARFGCPVTLRCAGALSADATAQLTGLEEQELPGPEEGLLIIDGLLGSGAVGELRPAYAALVRELNALRAASQRSLTLAIDIPTGLNAATGTCGADVVRADATAVIGAVKPGLLADGAEDAVGRLFCIPLPEVGDLPLADTARVACAAELAPLLPRDAHAYHLVAPGTELCIVVAQAAGLSCTARCIVFRVEIEYYLLATIVAEQYFFAILIHSQALGSLVAYIHMSLSF